MEFAPLSVIFFSAKYNPAQIRILPPSTSPFFELLDRSKRYSFVVRRYL
jgi:hypothetical protein